MRKFAPLIGGEPTNDSEGISRLRWVALVNDDTTTTLGLGQLSPQFGHGGSMAWTGLEDGPGSLRSPLSRTAGEGQSDHFGAIISPQILRLRLR